MSGFGADVEVAWPGLSFPPTSSAVPRTELDERIRLVAVDDGAKMKLGAKAVDVERDSSGGVSAVVLDSGEVIRCETLIVADGARSTLGRVLGREWHRETVYGVAVRGYIATPRSSEPWITSHLELRSPDGDVLPGYGWIFPLGNGEVNIGVGALATSKRPSDAALRPLMNYYAGLRRDEWGFDGEPRAGLVGAAADGRCRLGGSRPELDADRRRRGVCQSAQRRRHRLRPGDRQAGRGPARQRAIIRAPGRPSCTSTTPVASRSRAGLLCC